MILYTGLVGISPDLQLWCSWGYISLAGDKRSWKRIFLEMKVSGNESYRAGLLRGVTVLKGAKVSRSKSTKEENSMVRLELLLLETCRPGSKKARYPFGDTYGVY